MPWPRAPPMRSTSPIYPRPSIGPTPSRPIKQPLTLRLDADVIAWFKNRATAGEKYQTTINRVLREYVEQHGRSA